MGRKEHLEVLIDHTFEDIFGSCGKFLGKSLVRNFKENRRYGDYVELIDDISL